MARGKVTKRKATPKKAGAGRVVEILDSDDPLKALQRFVATIGERASVQEGQIALGAAQLLLVGETDVAKLIDLILANWERLTTAAAEGTTFHAEAFLRNAFEADDDPTRLEHLLMLASAHGIDLVEEDVAVPAIPVRVEPHMRPVRAALDALIAQLGKLGQAATTNPPASLDAVLAVENVRQIQLPNDYRALLTITDGLAIWDNTFFSTEDYNSNTRLAQDAREYLEMSARYGAAGIDACVPIANWGQPNDWLLYDPFGRVRRGEPGYVLMLNADELPLDDLVAVLYRIGRVAADVLGTN